MSAPLPAGLGRTLAFADGDLVLTPGGQDLAQVTGLAALAQALVAAVETQLGADRLNVTFGLDRLALASFGADPASRRAHLKMALVAALSADQRVAEVRDVVFEDEPQFAAATGLPPDVAAEIAAAARRSREQTVHVVLQTRTGDVLDVPLAGGPDV